MKKIKPQDVLLRFIEEEFSVPREEILRKGRRADYVKIRDILVYVAIQSGIGYAATGRLLNRDHTTMIHAYQKVSSNPETLEKARYLYEKFLGFKKKTLITNESVLIVKLTGKYAYLYERFGGKCIICGFDEVVEVHHIIPRRVGGDDSPENLILLCPNHHAMADRGMISVKGVPLMNSYKEDEIPLINHYPHCPHP